MKHWLKRTAAAAAAGMFGAVFCMQAAGAAAGEQEAAAYEACEDRIGGEDEAAVTETGWQFRDGNWYWTDEEGKPAQGFREIDGEWYYFFEDGTMNQEELFLENAVYRFTDSGALKSARWQENTGGGAYEAGCYDSFTQQVFDLLNEEKKELYFEVHPEREDGSDTDLEVYDRYAGFEMDMMLNKAAEYRLEAAEEKGYSGGKIPGEGTLGDWLEQAEYKKNGTWLEVYVKNCRDADHGFEKILRETEERYEIRGDRTKSLEYYRYAGLAHRENNGKHEILLILMR